MSTEKRDIAVVIGRFQPFHIGHYSIIMRALQLAEQVVIVIGSANQPRTIKNPFTVAERAAMIQSSFTAEECSRIICTSVEDSLYHENGWFIDVQHAVGATSDQRVAVLGYEKDSSSYYLNNFPNWEFIDIGGYTMTDNSRVIDATKIRELMFEKHTHYVEPVVPPSVYHILLAFTLTSEYNTLVSEHEYIKMYRKQWDVAPYPVTFFTVDSVVVQSGHVLLIQRKAQPGKGLWAIPGGFIDQHETAFDSAIRELKEETKIKVPEAVLRGSVKHEKLFDAPDRSLRGRTITQAFLFELPPQEKLPKVKGSDDAAVAKWFSFDEVSSMTDQMFEDHASIIKMMINRTK